MGLGIYIHCHSDIFNSQEEKKKQLSPFAFRGLDMAFCLIWNCCHFLDFFSDLTSGRYQTYQTYQTWVWMNQNDWNRWNVFCTSYTFRFYFRFKCAHVYRCLERHSISFKKSIILCPGSTLHRNSAMEIKDDSPEFCLKISR